MNLAPSGLRKGGRIFLVGAGASPKGDFPFLDKMDLKTLKTARLFHCTGKTYEEPLALLSDDGLRFITRHESLTEPPNYFLRHADGTKRALTEFTDPAPHLRKVKKQLVTYKRADGVQLSFTLYLPPDHQELSFHSMIFWFTGAPSNPPLRL